MRTSPQRSLRPATRSRRGRSTSHLNHASSERRALRFESLEDRRMLAVFLVTNDNEGPVNAAGDLPGSLRQAIFDANALPGADEIQFSVSGSFFFLGGLSSELEITETLTISGPAQGIAWIEGVAAPRILHYSATTGDLTVRGVRLAEVEQASDGGAILFDSSGTLEIIDSHVRGIVSGLTSGSSGAIFASRPGNVVKLTNSLVSGNISPSGNGGGFSVTDGSLIVTNSAIRGNNGGNFGGGIYISRGSLEVTNSTVSGNLAQARGGGISAHNGSGVTLTNSTVSGNSASGSSWGGGIYSLRTDVTLTSSTVTGNSSGLRGGGVYLRLLAAPSITVENSIIAGNTSSSIYPDLSHGVGDPITVNYSLIGDNEGSDLVEAQTPDANGNLIGSSAGAGIIDPLLFLLAVNGAPTLPYGGAVETHALMAGSPAIDAGDPSFASPPNYDQRGFAFDRIVGGRIDMGAFESGAASADFNTDGDIDGGDFLTWQRNFGDTTARHSDGDANIDGSVNGTDLSAWIDQFGEVEPPPSLALVSSGQEAVGGEELSAFRSPLSAFVEPSAPASRLSSLDSRLEQLDAALAWELLGSAPINQARFVVGESIVEEVFFESSDDVWLAPVNHALGEVDTATSDSDENEEHDQPWLDDKLLERVFG